MTELDQLVQEFADLVALSHDLKRQTVEVAREKAEAAKRALDAGAKNIDLAKAAGIHESNVSRLLRTIEPARYPAKTTKKNRSRGGTK